MKGQGFKNVITTVRRALFQVVTKPSFGIGQRALLVRTNSGNILWDCVTYLDNDTVSAINDLGGMDHIAVSHPHFYSAIVEWSEAFGGVPIYLHQLNKEWVQRSSPNIVYWKGRTLALLPGAEIIKLGGHFPGSSVLHLQGGEFGSGVLLSGDTIYVVMDRRWVSFMYSFPNHLPLPAHKVRGIASQVKPYKFEEIFSGFEGREIISRADLAVQRSAQRYLYHLKR
jgi:glyoxylase-like metal-dependent hydrolase (beta-lactamase superfamily II)